MSKMHTLKLTEIRIEQMKLFSWGKKQKTYEEALKVKKILQRKDPYITVAIVPKKSGYRVYCGYVE